MASIVESITEAWAQELQDLDTAATDLLDAVTLDGSSGVQLDGLGQIIGIERQGLDDDEYRSLLRAYIAINRSGGSIPEVIEIVRLALNTTYAEQILYLFEGSPAEFKVRILEMLDAGIGAIAADAMYAGKAAGVHAVLEYWETEPLFAFDALNGSKFDGGFYLSTAIRDRGARESEVL